MKSIPVGVQAMGAAQLYGLWADSSDASLKRDMARLAKEYRLAAGVKAKTVLPYYVLCSHDSGKSEEFRLFIGSTSPAPRLSAYLLAPGSYAAVTVRPKLGFLWGAAIGEAKRYFYTQWLPSSLYLPLNLEFELHTEKSLGRHACVDLLFAVAPRTAAAGQHG